MTRIFHYFVACCLMIVISIPGWAKLNDTRAPPSVAFFYGIHPPIAKLCQFDWVVVDPASDFSTDNYCLYQSTPIAYAALGEVGRGVSYESKIDPSWILGRNTAWNNNIIIDQTKPEWQQFFLNEIITPLWEKGYRGFFFDTLDSYQIPLHTQAAQQKQIDAMVSLITQVKQRFPDAIIILNRGFPMLPKLAPVVNAVVIESLYQAWNQAEHRYEKTAPLEQQMLFNEIAKIKQLNLPIIIIDYLSSDNPQKLAALKNKIKSQGLIPWITNNDLDQIYPDPTVNQTQKPFEREILVLYGNQNKLPLFYVPAIRYLGVILEHLGYIPVYRELMEQCPQFDCPVQSKQYAGIVLWVDTADSKNIPILKWVKTQIDRKVPTLFLHGFGVPPDASIIKELGLATASVKSTNTNLKVTHQDPHYIGQEIAPTLSPYDFFPICAQSGDVLLRLESDAQQTEDAVAIMPWGGYALNPFFITFLPNMQASWVINPFEFVSAALRLKTFPIPDTTTENGRRLFSVHVDGDGFANPARWLGGHIAAVELRDKILKRFRIPSSVSVITGEISPQGMNPDRSAYLMKVARSIFALPWVESASHSFSHPFLWVTKGQKEGSSIGEENFSLEIPNYQFNAYAEITGSVAFINQYLAPANRPCRLFFWSGMANPSAQQVAIADEGGLLNINGLNDTSISNHSHSLTAVRPLGLKRGNGYQIFAPIEMDFSYINQFSGPLYGFKKVIETWELTNQPRRLKPMDIYYHIYAAGYPAMLKALVEVYQWAMKQKTMPIYISEYIQKGRDFYHIQMNQSPKGWSITSNGELREFRSSPTLGYPDLEHSENVIGFNEFNHERYIHLGPGPVALIKYKNNMPTTPYLVDANARIIFWDQQGKHYRYRFKGHVPVKLTFANTSQCRVESPTVLKRTNTASNMQHFYSDKEDLEIRIDC